MKLPLDAGPVEDDPFWADLAADRRFPTARALVRLGARRTWGTAASVRIGIGLLGAIGLMCVFVPIAWPYSADALVAQPFASPSLSHPFGTDDLGRDVFVRAFAAGRIDITVAIVVVAISCTVGTIIGTVAGSTRLRWLDAVIARLVDALIAFPFLVTMLMLVVVIGPNARLGPAPRGLTAVFAAFLVIGWTFYARLARAQAASIRDRDFVVAARTIGYSAPRVIFRHIMPGVVSVNIAYAVADAILTMGALAAFSFLGVGVQPPTPEWGNMMSEGSAYLQSAWWITVFPGILLALTGFALSLVADGLLRGRKGK